eukprot:6948938-Prymnesium_polylepis.1
MVVHTATTATQHALAREDILPEVVSRLSHPRLVPVAVPAARVAHVVLLSRVNAPHPASAEDPPHRAPNQRRISGESAANQRRISGGEDAACAGASSFEQRGRARRACAQRCEAPSQDIKWRAQTHGARQKCMASLSKGTAGDASSVDAWTTFCEQRGLFTPAEEVAGVAEEPLADLPN